MFASKPRLEFSTQLVIIAVVLCNVFVPTSALATSLDPNRKDAESSTIIPSTHNTDTLPSVDSS